MKRCPPLVAPLLEHAKKASPAVDYGMEASMVARRKANRGVKAKLAIQLECAACRLGAGQHVLVVSRSLEELRL